MDRVGKRPQVKLVHGLVVDIGGEGLGNIEAVTLGLTSLAEVF